MTGTRKMLVGFVAVLSLLGVGGGVQAATASSAGAATATRWCC
jgi:hypothetical protein